MPAGIDRHHISFPRQEHELRPQAAYIRGLGSLIPPMYRERHNELHRHCPAVPTLGYYMLQRVAADVRDEGDTFETLDKLLLAIDRACEHPKAKPLERELGQLVIMHYELQLPYLKDGIVKS